jgi:hypothetical protein
MIEGQRTRVKKASPSKRSFLYLLSLLVSIALFSLLSLISRVYAGSAPGTAPVNLTSIPQVVGQALSIPEPNTALFGGLIIGMVLFLAITLPALLLPHGGFLIIFGFLALCLNCGLGFWPSWSLLFVVLIASGTMARQIMKWFR